MEQEEGESVSEKKKTPKHKQRGEEKKDGDGEFQKEENRLPWSGEKKITRQMSDPPSQPGGGWTGGKNQLHSRREGGAERQLGGGGGGFFGRTNYFRGGGGGGKKFSNWIKKTCPGPGRETPIQERTVENPRGKKNLIEKPKIHGKRWERHSHLSCMLIQGWDCRFKNAVGRKKRVTSNKLTRM